MRDGQLEIKPTPFPQFIRDRAKLKSPGRAVQQQFVSSGASRQIPSQNLSREIYISERDIDEAVSPEIETTVLAHANLSVQDEKSDKVVLQDQGATLAPSILEDGKENTCKDAQGAKDVHQTDSDSSTTAETRQIGSNSPIAGAQNFLTGIFMDGKKGEENREVAVEIIDEEVRIVAVCCYCSAGRGEAVPCPIMSWSLALRCSLFLRN